MRKKPAKSECVVEGFRELQIVSACHTLLACQWLLECSADVMDSHTDVSHQSRRQWNCFQGNIGETNQMDRMDEHSNTQAVLN